MYCLFLRFLLSSIIIMAKYFVSALCPLSLFTACLSAPTTPNIAPKVTLQPLPGPYSVGRSPTSSSTHRALIPTPPPPSREP